MWTDVVFDLLAWNRVPSRGKQFLANEGNQPSSVLLIGGDHTKESDVAGSESATVQHYAGVDPKRVIDLSGSQFY
jgi:hypothetical protein